MVSPEFVVITISGENRMIPGQWWEEMEGPKPDFNRWEGSVAFVETILNNGCSFSPDEWFGCELWPACTVHDYHYGPLAPVGKGKKGRKIADKTMRKNHHILLRLQGVGRVRRTYLSWFYYQGVRKGGKYVWRHGNN